MDPLASRVARRFTTASEELFESGEVIADLLKELKKAVLVETTASAILASIQEKLLSRLLAKAVSTFQKRAAYMNGTLQPMLEDIQESYRALELQCQKRVSQKSSEIDPTVVKSFLAKVSKFDAVWKRFMDQRSPASDLEELEHLESKPINSVLKSLGTLRLDDTADLGFVLEELEDIEGTLAEWAED